MDIKRQNDVKDKKTNFCFILGCILQRLIQDFLKGGSNPSGGGSFSTFYLIFHKFSHEIEIIWFQKGVKANHQNPL